MAENEKKESRGWALRSSNSERVDGKDPEVKEEQRSGGTAGNRAGEPSGSGVSGLKEPSFKAVVSDVMYHREVR